VDTRSLTESSVVLLDFGGTLDADGLTWKERLTRLYREEGVVIAPERFDPVFYAADDALGGAVPPTLSFRETVFRLVAGVARGLGFRDDALVDRITTRFLEDATETLRQNMSLLSALSRSYRLGIVSNFYGNLATVCEECGIHEFFSVLIDSAQVGCRKPDPRIFQMAVNALGVTPADAVFVGDSLARDMAGARAVGMPHIRLVAATSQDREACCPGDTVVDSLKDLEELLL